MLAATLGRWAPKARIGVAFAAATSSAIATVPAHARQTTQTTQAAAARDIVQEVNQAYDRGEFQTAAALLAEAYAADPRPGYLYSMGESLLAADDCEGATRAFKRFLATNPPDIDADAARKRVAECEPALAPAPPEPVPPPAAAVPTAVTADPTTVRGGAPRRDPLFVGLVVAGGVFAAAGTGLLVGASITAADTANAGTEDVWEAGVLRSRGLATGGAVVLSLGGALLVGALVRGLVSRRARQRSPIAWVPSGARVQPLWNSTSTGNTTSAQ